MYITYQISNFHMLTGIFGGSPVSQYFILILFQDSNDSLTQNILVVFEYGKNHDDIQLGCD